MDLSDCRTKDLRLRSHISRKKHIKHSESRPGSLKARNRMKYTKTIIITIKKTRLWLFSFLEARTAVHSSSRLAYKLQHPRVAIIKDKNFPSCGTGITDSLTYQCMGKNKWLSYPGFFILFAGLCDVFLHLLGSLMYWGTALPTAGTGACCLFQHKPFCGSVTFHYWDSSGRCYTQHLKLLKIFWNTLIQFLFEIT